MNSIVLDHNKVINKLSDSNLCPVVQSCQEPEDKEEKKQGWDDEIEIDLDEMQFDESPVNDKEQLRLQKLASSIVDHAQYDNVSFEEYLQTKYLSADVEN